MAIDIVCPECGAQDQVPDSAVGKEKRCKICGASIKIEDVPESQLEQEQRRKSNKKAKSKAKQQAQVQQNLMSLLIFLAGMLILGGIALGAYLVPSFRDLLEQILVVAGAAAAIVGYVFIMFTEEEPLIRSLMRYFPPALVFSVLKRPHETWP